jgi:putative hydrolase of the HAD superfamily
METLGRELKAVAFDLDGTLYPNYRLYRRLVFFSLRNPRFFSAFISARHKLHNPDRESAAGVSFYDEQASLMAEILGRKTEEVKEKVETLIYRGWEQLFTRIKPFPQVRDTLESFRRAGLKLAVLSDFPPERKIPMLGLDGLFDCILSTEETGALKPSVTPFAALSQSLNLESREILYVGNSSRYDVAGAKLAGMKTALIKRSILSTGYSRNTGGADLVFRNYHQLHELVLGNTLK